MKIDLNQTKNTTEKINKLNAIAKKFDTENQDSIYKYANKAVNLATENSHDQGIANAWINLALYYHYKTEFDSVDFYMKNASEKFIQINDSLGLANSYNYMGFSLERRGNVNQAEKLYTTAIKINENIGTGADIQNTKPLTNLANVKSSKGQFDEAFYLFNKTQSIIENNPSDLLHQEGNVFNGLAITYERQGKLDSTLFYLGKAEKIYKKLGLQGNLFVVNNNKASVYRKKSNLPQAIRHYKIALSIAEKLGNKRHQSIGLNNLGICYLDLEDNEEALVYFEKAAMISKEIDLFTYVVTRSNVALILKDLPERSKEAEVILLEALNYFDEQNLISSKPQILNNLAEIYFNQKDLTLAKKTYYEAKKIGEELRSIFDLAFTYNGLSEIALYEKKPDSTIYYAQKVINNDKDEINLEGLSFAHQMLQKAFNEKGNFELALFHFEKHKEMDESIFNEEKSKEIGRAEIENEFNLQQELLSLSAERKLLQQENKIRIKNMQLIIAGIILIIVIFIIVLFILQHKKQLKSQKELTVAKQNINYKNKQLKQLSNQKNQLFSLVAKDLKQPLNQLLKSFKSTHKDKLNEQNKAEISQLLESTLITTNILLNWASQEMRENKTIEEDSETSLQQLIESVKNQLSKNIRAKNILLKIDLENPLRELSNLNAIQTVLLNILNEIIHLCKTNEELLLSVQSNENDKLKFCISFPTQILVTKVNLEKIEKNELKIELAKDIIQKHDGNLKLTNHSNYYTLCFKIRSS